MSDPFESSKRRLKRANYHTARIKDLVQAFGESKPYTCVVEQNPGGFEEHKVKLTGEIPCEITDLTVEAIEGLRASLDHAITAIGEAVGMGERDLSNLHFPVSNSKGNFDNLLNEPRFSNFPAHIKAFLSALDPYQGGNEILWALNRVRRQSAHRLIVPVGTAPHGAVVQHIEITTPVWCDVPPFNWDREKNEVVIVRAGQGSDLKYKIDIAFHIAFGPVETLAGYEITSSLSEMCAEVADIIAGLETTSQKAGLFS